MCDAQVIYLDIYVGKCYGTYKMLTSSLYKFSLMYKVNK
jgi:hypothetical protein